MRPERRGPRGAGRRRSVSWALSSFALFGVLAVRPALGGLPTPTPTREPIPCVGDCDGDDVVEVSELILGVHMALHGQSVARCPAFDHRPDDSLTIDELLLSVAASNDGCDLAPTPTPTATPGGATLAEIQSTIFTPRCAIIGCHGGAFPANNLSLESGESYDTLIDREPFNPEALDRGLLLVDPGDPDNSFLLIKVEGPPAGSGLGDRMPLFPPMLTPTQIQLIRDWIEQGAIP